MSPEDILVALTLSQRNVRFVLGTPLSLGALPSSSTTGRYCVCDETQNSS
jgi:hypothetical protein